MRLSSAPIKMLVTEVRENGSLMPRLDRYGGNLSSELSEASE